MTSTDTPPEGFETKQVPGYVPAVVPAGGDPVGHGIVAGFSNTPSGDKAAAESANRAQAADRQAADQQTAGAEGGGDAKSTGGTSTAAKSTTTKSTGTKSS